jgi:hypothetical protein
MIARPSVLGFEPARLLVHPGGNVEEVVDGRFMRPEIDRFLAGRAGNGIAMRKLRNDLVKGLTALRTLTLKLEQNLFRVIAHGLPSIRVSELAQDLLAKAT